MKLYDERKESNTKRHNETGNIERIGMRNNFYKCSQPAIRFCSSKGVVDRRNVPQEKGN